MKPSRSRLPLRVAAPGPIRRGFSGLFGGLISASQRWLTRWWHTLHGGALLLVLALSPSSYARVHRPVLAQQLYFSTLPVLPGFAVLAALISLVLIRIVIVTAVSYGLSQYALEMVVRVLVLELIPLSAALYVALRCTLPGAAALARRRGSGRLDVIRHELLPRVVAGSFAVLLFAAVACALAMLLAYAAVYGLTLAAFAGFTRTLGQIFNPGVVLIFSLKTLLFSLAVALIPLVAMLREVAGAGATGQAGAAAAQDPRLEPGSEQRREQSPEQSPAGRAGSELNTLVRLFSVVLLIEAVSLVGNYH